MSKIIVPPYYNDFKCIADKCKHSCCVGWEIDIDPDTYERYMAMSGEIGDKLREGIVTDRDSHSFKMSGDKRCTFLNANNLCELILATGDDKCLCDICSDHPRFRHYDYDDNEYIGLGLCCEEACRMILSYPGKAEVENICFWEATDRTMKITDRMNAMSEVYHDFKEVLQVVKSFEVLDPMWTDMLANCRSLSREEIDEYLDKSENSIAMEQLMVYFIYRYPDGPELAVEATRFIAGLNICLNTSGTFEEMCDIVRMFSSEVEYSDINIEAFEDFCWEKLT